MNLNFKVFGEGQPIIILHGLFGMLDNWQTIGKKLAKTNQVFLVDLRNHGRSPHDQLFNYDIMAEDIEEFMLSQWIYGGILIGHSMGAKVAMQTAFNRPDLVDRLISVDMGIKSIKRSHDPIFDSLRGINLETISSRKEVEELLSDKISDIGTRLFLLKNLSRKKDKSFQWKMNLEVIHQNYDEILKPLDLSDPFKNPSLFIRGQKSNYIMDEDWAEISSLFTEARLVTIENSGHWVHADQPELILSTINSWIHSA